MPRLAAEAFNILNEPRLFVADLDPMLDPALDLTTLKQATQKTPIKEGTGWFPLAPGVFGPTKRGQTGSHLPQAPHVGLLTNRGLKSVLYMNVDSLYNDLIHNDSAGTEYAAAIERGTQDRLDPLRSALHHLAADGVSSVNDAAR